MTESHARPSSSEPRHDDPESAVRAVLARWTTAIENGDREGLVAEHADNIVMFDVIPPMKLEGMDAYRGTWELFFAEQSEGVFRLDDLEITAGEDVAFCHSIVTCGTHDPESQFQVRLTVGLRKIDGRWLITHEHHSAPGEAE